MEKKRKSFIFYIESSFFITSRNTAMGKKEKATKKSVTERFVLSKTTIPIIKTLSCVMNSQGHLREKENQIVDRKLLKLWNSTSKTLKHTLTPKYNN